MIAMIAMKKNDINLKEEKEIKEKGIKEEEDIKEKKEREKEMIVMIVIMNKGNIRSFQKKKKKWMIWIM